MRKVGTSLLILAVAAISRPIEAQPSNTPGVTEVAPGVRQIDGSQVPSTQIGFSALKAAIESDRSFSKIKHLFTVAGIDSPGPSGTTTYMYKVHDPETGKDGVAILFVKDGKILNYMIT
jgi:hypothetical protein